MDRLHIIQGFLCWMNEGYAYMDNSLYPNSNVNLINDNSNMFFYLPHLRGMIALEY